MSDVERNEHDLLQVALRSALDTQLLQLDRGARFQVGNAFAALFGNATAVVIADENTFAAAGRDVCDALATAAQPCADAIILPADGLYAEYSFVEQLQQRLQPLDAIPIAVGAGTINDLVKLAAHQCGRPYMAVATAASMDGYTAYGASITHRGSKQTFECPAPWGVIADLDVLAAAPPELNAAGYADLAAKCPAGADWLLADFLGEEAIDPLAWKLVQSQLCRWMAEPAGIRQGNVDTLRRVTMALMMTGFAMQAARSSRPASGAEHQFSHLWDMQHHMHRGQTPSHGFKVGIGSLASLAIYEALMQRNLGDLDLDAAVKSWPGAAANAAEIAELFSEEELAAKAREESGAKLISADRLRIQLDYLRRGWTQLRHRLEDQLIPASELRDMLREAGAPYHPEQIGISATRLRRSYCQAYHIRRRYTVLDLARRTGLLQSALDDVFANAVWEAVP